MKSRSLAVVAAVLLLIGGAGFGYWLAGHRAAGSAVAGASDKTTHKPLYWHDPMVPGTRFDKPGKSPFMDMQLVPVYADDAAKDAGISIDPSVTQKLGVRTGKVERAVLTQSLKAVGSVGFDQRLLELVPARVEGYITRLYVKAPLEHVRKGQPLADITAPQWLAAQQEYLALLDAQSERGKSLRESARQRLLVLGIPESTVVAIEHDRKTRTSTTLFAPRDGVITESNAREGGAFAPGDVLFRINGLESVWVDAQLPEVQAGLARAGTPVTVHAIAWPGEQFKGEVTELLAQLDVATRTLTSRIRVDNRDAKLVPGMSVSLDIASRPGVSQLVVPSEAVIVTGTRSVVIVERNDHFNVIDVVVGSEGAGRSSILSGLDEGDTVVLSGQFLIDSEASLKATTDRLSEHP
ncbi:MAG: efflux RND transporter periplasmic adaptor subunit [Pseudomonadota bacterium]